MKKDRENPVPDRAQEPAARASPDESHSKAASDACVRVVGLGGSAGGLEAFEQFFDRMAADSGMAFVVVSHLDPTHKGMMPELLQRHTAMPVVQAKDGMPIRPNAVYVIPPNADLSMLHGTLQLFQPAERHGLRLPIDFFFRSLAADQKEKAIGVVLSGMGSDGTAGLKAIKENLGLALVQDPTSAKYAAMPQSAVNAGVADYVAGASELPAQLLKCAAFGPIGSTAAIAAEPNASDALQKIFILLRSHAGNDFSCYKPTTVLRRIERRMAVHQLDSLARYVRFLCENAQEVDLLYKELLIGVTSFFRDPGLFDYLKEKALPALLDSRPRNAAFRIWVPGCSTGEEPYSLAIVLRECLERAKPHSGSSVQIFATDLDKDAIDRARRGVFPAAIAADVSPERLERFFVRDEANFRIRREVRDMLVFAPQNVLADPPFTKLNVVCCRNLLIYLNADTQRRLLRLMHYALNPGGLLILGLSESVGDSGPYFSTIEKKWKVFERTGSTPPRFVDMPSAASPFPRVAPTHEPIPESTMDISFEAQRALLDTFGPPAIVINREGDIVYLSNRTGKYLEPASGKVNMNAYAMAREGLREQLGPAIRRAEKQSEPVVVRDLKVKSNGGFTAIRLRIQALAEPAALRGLFLVVFEEAPQSPAKSAEKEKPAQSPSELGSPVAELNEALRLAREQLQTTTEEMGAMREELNSANEELQSNNEELQSTNEELTTSKEELQALNEEMQTVNAELQSKLDEVTRINDDMKNLINGIDIATIFLDNQLNVKRFTAQATKIVNLIAGDVKRPFTDMATNLKYDRLNDDARAVLDTLIPAERQVQTQDDRWYTMRILPYRTQDNVIDGVVLTFTDITALKTLEATLRLRQCEKPGSQTGPQEPHPPNERSPRP